jgi:hypothetical protein
MSGGSFDYLADKLEGMSAVYSFPLDLLASMADWLEEPEQNQPDAAKELRKAHKELSELAQKLWEKYGYKSPLYQITHAAEWWCSHDTGQDDFENVWNKVKSELEDTK